MPPRPKPSAPLSLSASGFFYARVTDVSAAPAYSFVEVWIDATGAAIQKVGGRFGDKNANPGYSVTGATFSANEVVLCRSAEGAAGTFWELAPARSGTISGEGTDNHICRFDGTGLHKIQDSTASIDDSGNVTVNGTISATSSTNANVSSQTVSAYVALLTNPYAVSSAYPVGCYARQSTLANSAVAFINDKDGNAGVAFETPTHNFILTGDVTVSPSTTVTASYAVNRGTVAAPSIQVGADATVSGLVFKGGLYISGALSGVGTVTSVGLSMPSGFSVSGSPVSTSGTLAVTTSLSGVIYGTGSGFAAATIDPTLTFSAPTLGIDLTHANTWTGLQSVKITDAVTAAPSDLLVLDHESSGTPAAGFGLDLHLKLKSATVASRDAALIETVWVDAADATRNATLGLYAYEGSSARLGLKIGASSGPTIGFLNTAPAGQQTGDAGTALVTFGLMSGTPTFAAANLTGTVSAAKGGTGLDSSAWAQGDLPYISATGVWNHLAKSASSTRYLSNTGTSNNPAWAQVDLTNGVTGTLPEGNGGTNQSTYAKGDILYSSATNALAKLAGNTTSTKNFLTQTGTGSVSAAPAWGTIAAADYPTFVAAGGSHAKGAVPDPSATSHSNQPYYLGDDAAWHPPNGKCIGQNFTAISETTTSTSAADLTTVQSLSVTPGTTSEKYTVAVSATVANNTAGAVCRLHVDVDGTATTVAQFTVKDANTNYNAACVAFNFAAGAAGTPMTIKIKFSVNAGTGTFSNRALRVDMAEN